MRNPFNDLGKPRLEQPQGEEVSGCFSCQERGCYNVVTTARYLEEVKVLTWKCKDGHISEIRDFIIE